MNKDMLPDPVREEIEQQLDQLSYTINWLDQLTAWYFKTRDILRDIQLQCRDQLLDNEGHRVGLTELRRLPLMNTLGSILDLVDEHFPEFDTVSVPTIDQVQMNIDDFIAQGLLEEVSPGKYTLTREGKTYTQRKIQENPEMKDLYRKIIQSKNADSDINDLLNW